MVLNTTCTHLLVNPAQAAHGRRDEATRSDQHVSVRFSNHKHETTSALLLEQHLVSAGGERTCDEHCQPGEDHSSGSPPGTSGSETAQCCDVNPALPSFSYVLVNEAGRTKKSLNKS